MESPVQNKSSLAYRDLAIAFLFMNLVVTMIRSILKDIFGPDYVLYLIGIFAPSMVILFPLAFRVIVKLNASTLIIRSLALIFATGILTRIIALFILTEMQSKLALNLISSSLIIVFLITTISIMIKNLFAAPTRIVEKLWSSVCVYFMISLLFATYYSVLLLLNPDALGVPMMHPVEIYLNGVVYSVNVLSGFDTVFQNVSESVQMGAIMESLISMLFLVVLLGRLLGSSS